MDLDLSSLEKWLWDAACAIRGPVDAPKFKDYILPLVFLKRLSDVFDDEVAHLADELGSPEIAATLVEQDHRLVSFYIPLPSRWALIATRTTAVGEYLTDVLRAVSRENPALAGVIDTKDYNATTEGQREIDDQRLLALVRVLSNPGCRLGLKDVEPDILGRAYEYLLRKFAEGQGQSAGEFYTPREVGVLMARLLDPQPGMSVYDPCCGSGGLLLKTCLRLREIHGVLANGRIDMPHGVAPLALHGQEINTSTFAMARMNAFVHQMEARIAPGDTMHRPAFTTSDGRLREFDLVVANPMWKQKFDSSTYENDLYGRFRDIPPPSSADWGWLQHMLASLAPAGRMAVVLDTGSVSRGSGSQGSNRERDARKRFVDEDLIEAVLLLPENLFYNTTAAGIVLVVNRRKRHPWELMVLNASRLFEKGRSKNQLAEAHLDEVANAYSRWQSVDGLAAVVTVAEVVKNDYNLSPRRYIANGEHDGVLPLDEAMFMLQEAGDERDVADKGLERLLLSLGLSEVR
jgi:type I restriction enzyme M protein